jgi:hypothetical protein
LPSNASNRSNTPSVSNLQTQGQGTENILSAVSASLVYAGANKNGSQNITPVASKPASVTGENEREAVAVPHSYFVSNISIPDIGIIDEEAVVNNNNATNATNATTTSDNIVIDILPLTQDNLNTHENVMLQQLPPLPKQNETIITISDSEAVLPPLIFDELDPEGMM